MATINNVPEDEPQPTALEKQVQVLLRPLSASPSRTRSWKSSYIGRRTIILQKTWKILVLSGETAKDQKEVTPQADWSGET